MTSREEKAKQGSGEGKGDTWVLDKKQGGRSRKRVKQQK